jgi:probable F420-dependent oxidoreductase
MVTEVREALGPLGVWAHLDSLPALELRPYVERIRDLGYDALWVPETVGREPFTLLGALTASAGRMWLGTSIVSIWGRDALATRMAALTLQELTGGRFVLGLGVSHPHLVQKLRGHAYERPLGHLREYLESYRRLPYRGPRPATTEGPRGTPVVERGSDDPPLVVAALRERMLRFAATEADGAFPYLVTPERLTWMRSVLDEAAAGVGRPRPFLAVTQPAVLDVDAASARSAARAYLAPYLRTPNYQTSWQGQGFGADDWALPGSDRLIDSMVAWGTADTLRARLERLRQSGADHVAVIPLSPSGVTEHLPVLGALGP